MGFDNDTLKFVTSRDAALIVPLTLVPFVLVDLAVSSIAAALVLVGFSLLVSGLGFLTQSLMRGKLESAPNYLLAPALGLLVGGSLVSLGIRPGVPPGILLWVIFLLGAVGFIYRIRRKGGPGSASVPASGPILLLAALVCLVYFLPGASRDARITEDGGYRWMYVDTQYMTAIASSIKGSNGPPLNPGLATETLNYHYAPFALAGAVSAGTGLDLGDSLVRVVRPACQHALFCAVVALGMLLGPRVKAARFGGLAAAIGFFFYGSLSALFSPFGNSTSTTADAALIYALPYINVFNFGGPFSHLLLGHSVASGMMGLSAVLAILLWKASNPDRSVSNPDVFCLLPGLLATWHMMAGVGALGIVAAVTVFYGLRKLGSWASFALTVAGFAGVAIGMGYLGYPSASTMTLDPDLPNQLFETFVWVFIGLGVRVIAFRWITDLKQNPAGLILLLAIVGYGCITVFIFDVFDSHDWYGMKFLQTILSIFAFVMLAGYVERRERWTRPLLDTAKIVMWGSVGYLVLGLTMKVLGVGAGESSGQEMDFVRLAIISAVLAILACGVLLILHQRVPVLGRLAVIAMAGVYLLGFLAWVTPWYFYGLGKGGMDLVLSPPEVKILRMIREESEPTDLLATNRHGWDRFHRKNERSYAYRPVAERPVLIEGWHNGEGYLPSFEEVQRDNNLVFTGSDPARVEEVIRRRRIRYIVARPGTDLEIADLGVPWLQRMEGSGPIAAYRILDPDEYPTAPDHGE